MAFNILVVSLLLLPQHLLAQELDRYSSYYQCLDELFRIPLFDKCSTEPCVIKKAALGVYPLFDESKKRMYLAGEKRVLRYELEKPETNERGATVYSKRHFVFDGENDFYCLHLNIEPGGKPNVDGCNFGGLRRDWKSEEYQKINGEDFQDTLTIKLLRAELLKLIEFRMTFAIKRFGSSNPYATQYETDLTMCRGLFAKDKEIKDQEVYDKIQEFLQNIPAGAKGSQPTVIRLTK